MMLMFLRDVGSRLSHRFKREVCGCVPVCARAQVYLYIRTDRMGMAKC